MKSPRPSLPMTGGCQCGAIRYEITSFPLLLYTCNCTDCQRQTGSAFALNMPVRFEDFRILQGEPNGWHHTSPNGTAVISRGSAAMRHAAGSGRMLRDPAEWLEVCLPGRWTMPMAGARSEALLYAQSQPRSRPEGPMWPKSFTRENCSGTKEPAEGMGNYVGLGGCLVRVRLRKKRRLEFGGWTISWRADSQGTTCF